MQANSITKLLGIQGVRDIPYNGKPTLWYLSKRRFNCSCGRRFTEEFKALGKHRQLSNRLYSEILKELNEITSFAQVARRFRVSVPTVKRVPDLISINDRPKLPEVLSIDEFKGNTDHIRYHCVLVDAKNRRLLDVLCDRKYEYLAHYFRRYTAQERGSVKYFVCDMWKPYKQIAEIFFPNAKLIIDKYHYVRTITWAIDAAHKRIQKKSPGSTEKDVLQLQKTIAKSEKALEPTRADSFGTSILL